MSGATMGSITIARQRGGQVNSKKGNFFIGKILGSNGNNANKKKRKGGRGQNCGDDVLRASGRKYVHYRKQSDDCVAVERAAVGKIH